MGLIRKMASASTLGGIKYTSRREAETKERLASAKLAKAELKQVKNNSKEASNEQWEDILEAIRSGDASWEDLTKLQKLTMPVGYQLKCKKAERESHQVSR